MSRHIGLVKRS